MTYAGPRRVPRGEIVREDARRFDEEMAKLEPVGRDLDLELFDRELALLGPIEAPSLPDTSADVAAFDEAVAKIGDFSLPPEPEAGPYPGAPPHNSDDPHHQARGDEVVPAELTANGSQLPDFDQDAVDRALGVLGITKPPASEPADKLTRNQGGTAQAEREFDYPTPDPPSPMQNLMPRLGPAGLLLTPPLPIEPGKPVPPSQDEQDRVREGRGPLGAEPDPLMAKLGIRDVDPALTAAVGGLARGISKQQELSIGGAEGTVGAGFRHLDASDAAMGKRAFTNATVETSGPGGDSLTSAARGAGDVSGAGGAMGAPRRLDVPGEAMGEVDALAAPALPKLPRPTVARRIAAKLPKGALVDEAAETLAAVADEARAAHPARAANDPAGIAARLGVEPEALAKHWDEADPEDAGTLRALVGGMDGKARELVDLADDVGDGSYTAAARFALALEEWRALNGVASGTDPNAAKFLPARRRRLSGLLESGDPQAIRHRIAGIEGQTRRVAAMVGGLRDRPDEIPAVLRAALAEETGGLGAWSRAAFYTALLSSPWTHVRNIVSNTAMTGIDTAMRPAYVAADAALSVVKGRERVMSLNEAPAQAIGALLGLRVGWTNAVRAFSDPEVFDAVAKLELRHGGGGGMALGADSTSPAVRGAGQALSVTGRALAAGDALSRGVNTLARSYGEAARFVAKMPAYGGRPVTDPEVWRKVTEVAKNLPREAGERVGRASDELVFQDADKLTETITKVRDRIPLGWTQLPFTGTPTNIWKATIKYTFGPNANRWAELKAGDPIEQAETVGRALVSASIGTAAWVAAENGLITGSAPDFDDPDRDQWLAENQERSFRIPDGRGGVQFVAYKDVLPVFAPLLTGVADAHRALRYTKKPEDAAGKTIAGFVSAMLDVPFAPEILGDVHRWLSGDGGDIEDVARSLVRPIESVAAPALERFGARAYEQLAGDPTVRDTTPRGKGVEGFAEGVGNRVRANYPGATDLPPRLDLFGEPVERQKGETLSPITAGQRGADPILQELSRLRTKRDPVSGETLGSSLQPISRTQRGERLDPWNYHHAQRAAGKATRAGLEKLMAAEEYRTATDAAKVKQIKDAVKKARADALDEVLGAEPPRTPTARATPTPAPRSATPQPSADRRAAATATAAARR